MITQAYLQQVKCPEIDLLKRGLTSRNILWTLIPQKKLERNQVQLDPSILIAGYVSFVHHALRVLKVDTPPTNDYPTCLESYLHRRVWRSTLGNVESGLTNGSLGVVFVKPLAEKKFTGRVLYNHDSFYTNGASRQTKVWCSDPVTWRSEYRVFVLNGQNMGIKHYSGDPDIFPDVKVIQDMILKMEGPKSYALDVGVLEDGNTALVEFNDCYSLGSYGLESDFYTDMILARWEELMFTLR